MTESCITCGGPLEGHRLDAIWRCGYCLEIHMERLGWQTSFYEMLRAFATGSVQKNDIEMFLSIHHLRTHELASQILEWHFQTHTTFNTFLNLQALKIPEIQSALNKISDLSVQFQLAGLLAKNASELEIGEFLGQHTYLLRAATGTYHQGDTVECVRAFHFREDLTADFLILYPRRSIPPSIVIVELASPQAPLFTTQGIPSQELLEVTRRTRELFQWTTNNREEFNKASFRQFSGRIDPTSLREWFWINQIKPESYIIIGRRERPDQTDKRNVWQNDDPKITIHTYDTLLEIAEDFDLDMLDKIAELEAEEAIRVQRKGA